MFGIHQFFPNDFTREINEMFYFFLVFFRVKIFKKSIKTYISEIPFFRCHICLKVQ